MKRVLPTGFYTFVPGSNQIDFSPMGGAFLPSNLYAVIEITTGKLVYSVASSGAGFGGSFINGAFPNCVLVYASSNAGQAPTDTLQVIYDDMSSSANPTNSFTYAADGNAINATTNPVTGVPELNTNSTMRLHDAYGTLIGSTVDPASLRDGVDMNLLTSSYGGQVNQVLPPPFSDYALSVGILNNGTLRAPSMNFSNEIIVDATQSGNVPMNLSQVNGTAVGVSNPVPALISNPITGSQADFDLGPSGPDTLRTISNLATNGTNLTSSLNGSKQSLDVNITGSGATLGISSSQLPATLGAKTIANATAVSIASDQVVPVSSSQLPSTLGAKTIANATAVSIASDQIVPISTNETYVTGAGTLTAGNNIFLAVAGAGSTDAFGFKSGICQVVTAATTGAIFFEHSNDNVNFQPMPVFRMDSASPNVILTAITPVNSSFIYTFPIRSRYIRARISTALNANAFSFLRLSQESWSPIIPQVINSTGANLNATVGGTVAISSGTITTVSTVTTCSTVTSVTSAALAGTTTTDIASAAITTTQTSANISTAGIQNVSFQVAVTAVSGTTPTMDVVVQETFDGTNYYDIYHFPRITAAGQYQSPQMRMTGIGIRYVRTVGGTTPSFTNSVVRISRQVASDLYRNFLSRTIDPNTLNSTTASFNTEGCDQFQLVANMNSGGTAPVFKMQGSEDGTFWYDMITVTGTASSATQGISNGAFLPKFVRGIVSTAGTGSTLICLHLKARGV